MKRLLTLALFAVLMLPAVAQELTELGQEVLAIDENVESVQRQ